MVMAIIWLMMVNNLVGGWALPLWKMMEWKSVGMMKFPIYGKIENVPNHQPVWLVMCLLLQNHNNNDKTTNQDNIYYQT